VYGSAGTDSSRNRAIELKQWRSWEKAEH
jgi:hypothetical protein